MWVKSGVKANVSHKIYDRLTVAEPDTSVRYIEEVTSRQSRRIRLNPKWPQAQLQLQKTTRGDAAELNKGKAEEDMMTTQKMSNFHFLSLYFYVFDPL
ncbi:hypothetical protein NQZ68_005253 [Dissostichus eleginoides]|nr:hypothetical protein NQZ68_005253 [Dissostichus eleginoides]